MTGARIRFAALKKNTSDRVDPDALKIPPEGTNTRQRGRLALARQAEKIQHSLPLLAPPSKTIVSSPGLFNQWNTLSNLPVDDFCRAVARLRQQRGCGTRHLSDGPAGQSDHASGGFARSAERGNCSRKLRKT